MRAEPGVGMAKKLVDAEALMVWAAAELARKSPSKTPPRAAFAVNHGDAELVGKWTRPAGYPTVAPMWRAGVSSSGGARGGPPHADALAIEAALGRLSRSPPAVDIDALELGAGLGFPLDFAAALAAAQRNCENLLIVHGRLSSRPLFRLEPPEPSARMASNGKPAAFRLETWAEPTFADHTQAQRDVETPVTAMRKGIYPVGAYGVVEWTPSPADIVAERAEYAAWRAGLEWLAAELGDSLETRTPLPPGAAARPWLGEQDEPPVADLFGPGADRVHSGSEAASLEAERLAGRRRPIGGGSAYGFAPMNPGKGARKA